MVSFQNNGPEATMQHLDQFIVQDRLQELHREAAEERLAVRSRRAIQPRTSAWRRGGGAAARWISSTAANVAIALDPSLCRPSYGRE
jgi:hypothetical protein